MLLTDAIKIWLSVIYNAIYYLIIVLSTSSLLFSLYLIFQINYCLSEPVCTWDWSSTRCFSPQNCGTKCQASSCIHTNQFHRYWYELPHPLSILYSLCFLPVRLQLFPVNSVLLGDFKIFPIFDNGSCPYAGVFSGFTPLNVN